MTPLATIGTDVRAGLDLLRRLRPFLRHPVRVPEALAALRRRFERREADFLALVGSAVFDADSPYRRLLRGAGCERGDLERLVQQAGVEGALQTLLRNGVYLTTEEFKGRRPVVRGSVRFEVDPRDVRNPRSAGHVATRSTGSRGAPTDVHVDLGFIRDRAVDLALNLQARRPVGSTAEWRHAFWSVPGGTALARILEYRALGGTVEHWFTHVDPAAAGLPHRYRWSAGLLRAGSLLAGQRLPAPRYVPLDRPLPIVHELSRITRSGALPHLHTYVSPAVRLARAALDRGLDLEGVRLTVTGEPLTEARRRLLEQAGAEVWPRYGTTECSLIGYGCRAPASADDIHVFHDLYAVIHAGPANVAGLPPTALMVTTLRPTAPFVLLNLSLGDQGVLEPRACECPLARTGWRLHLHSIRSFEKLSAGGMTLLDVDVIRVLETVLPARFGGGPTDYQLVEDEAGDATPRLRLVIRPDVGPVDADAVAAAFLDAIAQTAPGTAVTSTAWREARLLTVERREPAATPTGKILHLHVDRAGDLSP